MGTKLESLSIYWLTFSRIVIGEIPLQANSLRDILFRPVPPYSYQKLCQAFTENLLLNSENVSFIDLFTLGPDRKPLPEERRSQLKAMYWNLLNDRSRKIIGNTPKIQRYISPNGMFHVPIQFDALFTSSEVDKAFVKYLFPYSDKYYSKPAEIDVLLATAACVIPSNLRNMDSNTGVLWPEYVSEHDYKFWALRFVAIGDNAEFYSVAEDRIEPIFTRVQEVSKKLDKLIGLIKESNQRIDDEFESSLFS